MAATSHRSAKWEVSGSALGSVPKVALGNRRAPGGAPEGAQGSWGCFRECSRQGFSCSLTLHVEHSRECSLEHPQFP